MFIRTKLYYRFNQEKISKSVQTALSPVCPLVDAGHVILEEPQVGPVSPLQAPHLVTAQQAYELLQSPLRGAARGGVHGPHPAHHPAQPREGQHQLLLRPGLQVHDVREVGDAGRTVLGVARPVGVLEINMKSFYEYHL